MQHIVLNDEQAKIIGSALQPVEVRDSKGNILGVLPPIWTEEDIIEAKKILASDQPWYTTEQVLAHLKSLDKK